MTLEAAFGKSILPTLRIVCSGKLMNAFYGLTQTGTMVLLFEFNIKEYVFERYKFQGEN